jgi:peptidoglycan/LPS O-acetylase OafA/YrhL
MTTTDLDTRNAHPTRDSNAPPTDPTAAPDALAAGAIYRRLERRQRKPQGLMAILFVLIAAALSLGVVAVERTSGTAPGASAAAGPNP